MGGTTPNFGIRYPYQGEVVNPTHFKNLSDDVDAGLATLGGLRDDALHMPACRVNGPDSGGGAASFASGVTTTLILGGGTSGSLVWWDNDGMKSPTVHDRLTVKTAGVYALTGKMFGSNSVSTLNAFALMIQITGSKTKTIQHKQNTQYMTNPQTWQVSGVWPLQVNDIIQLRGWWNGTGTTLTPGGVELIAQCLALI